MLDAGTSASLVLSDIRAVVSGVHDGRHDRTGFGHRMPGRIWPGTVHSTRHATRTEATREGTDERHGRHSDITDRHDHEDSLPGRRTPSSGAGVAAWQPRSTRRWQHCQRNRDHLSYKAAAWCRSVNQAAPRRIAVLGRLRVERRTSGEASSVMTSACAAAAGALPGSTLGEGGLGDLRIRAFKLDKAFREVLVVMHKVPNRSARAPIPLWRANCWELAMSAVTLSANRSSVSSVGSITSRTACSARRLDRRLAAEPVYV